MPPHGVGEIAAEQGVVTSSQIAENQRQRMTRIAVEIFHALYIEARQQQGLERPCGPPGHDDEPVVIRRHFAFAADLLANQVGEQEASVRLQIISLMNVLELGFLWKMVGRPDLSVRMRVGTPHHLAFVLEDLDPRVPSAERCRFRGPAIDDPPSLGGGESGHASMMIRRVADDPTTALDSFAHEEWVMARGGGGGFDRIDVEESREIVVEHVGAVVPRVDHTTDTRITGTQITRRVVDYRRSGARGRNLSAPGTRIAMRRYQHPTAVEWVTPAMNVVRRLESHDAEARRSRKPMYSARRDSASRLKTSAASTELASTNTMKWM